MPGFRITEQSIAELSADLAERVADLDPENTVVLIQLLDNSVFECLTEQGDKVLPKRGGDGKFHAPGYLKVIGKDSLRDLFMIMQPVFKVLKNFSAIILSPLPRYLWHRCCGDPTHISNSEQPDFTSEMGRGLKDLTTNLSNMIFMRKSHGLTVMNTVEALGIVPDEHGNVLKIERVLAFWGGGGTLSTQARLPTCCCPEKLWKRFKGFFMLTRSEPRLPQRGNRTQGKPGFPALNGWQNTLRTLTAELCEGREALGGPRLPRPPAHEGWQDSLEKVSLNISSFFYN
jgi:hypothetical protein